METEPSHSEPSQDGPSRDEPAHSAAALAGADVEVPSGPATGSGDDAVLGGVVLDEQSLEAVRQALPGWDVQPFQLSRAVDVAAGTDALRLSLEQVAQQRGRAPEVLVTGNHLVVRVRTPGVDGVTEQDVDLAAAMDAVFTGSHATGTDPGHL